MPPNRRRMHDRLSLPRLGRVPAAAAAIVAAVLLATGGSSSASDACTISWDGGAGSAHWEDAANWTGDGLPGDSDEVCIGSGAAVDFGGSSTVGGLRVDGALTVVGLGDLSVAGTHDSAVPGTLILKSGHLTLDADMTVAAFRQNGGILLGSGTLATPDFRWTAGAEVGTGTTEVTGAGAGLSLSGAVHTLDASRRLKIDSGASAVWTSGDLELRDTALLENAGLLDVQGDQDFSGCCGDAMKVVNEASGTIRKSAGDGDTRLTYALTNDGKLDVRSGTLAISGGDIAGRASRGSFEVADGATLAFTGSGFHLGSESTVTGHGSGGLLFKFGAVHLAGRVDAPVEMDGPSAYAFFDSDVTLPSVMLSRGFLGGPGRIATPDFRWSGGAQIGFGRTEIAAGGAGLAVSGDREHDLYERELDIDSGATAAWTEGTIAMTESGAIENAGLFDLRGDLSLSGCCDTRPRVHNAAGGTFRKSEGDGRAEVAYRFRNDGTVEADAGTLALTGGLQNFEADTLSGGTYIVRGTLEFPDARVVRNAASLTLDGPTSRVQDGRGFDGLRDLSANESPGDLTLTGGRQLELPGPDRDLSNAGSVTVWGNSGLSVGRAYRQSGGVTTLASPSARIGGADAVVDGGVLRGTGTVDATLTNSGEVQPGLVSPGVLTVTGDYRQPAAGALSMQIAGATDRPGHDRLDVGGAATLDGALRVETLFGFAPAPTDEFELIRHSSVEGDFGDVSGLGARLLAARVRARRDVAARGFDPGGRDRRRLCDRRRRRRRLRDLRRHAVLDAHPDRADPVAGGGRHGHRARRLRGGERHADHSARSRLRAAHRARPRRHPGRAGRAVPGGPDRPVRRHDHARNRNRDHRRRRPAAAARRPAPDPPPVDPPADPPPVDPPPVDPPADPPPADPPPVDPPRPRRPAACRPAARRRWEAGWSARVSSRLPPRGAGRLGPERRGMRGSPGSAHQPQAHPPAGQGQGPAPAGARNGPRQRLRRPEARGRGHRSPPGGPPGEVPLPQAKWPPGPGRQLPSSALRAGSRDRALAAPPARSPAARDLFGAEHGSRRGWQW